VVQFKCPSFNVLNGLNVECSKGWKPYKQWGEFCLAHIRLYSRTKFCSILRKSCSEVVWNYPTVNPNRYKGDLQYRWS